MTVMGIEYLLYVSLRLYDYIYASSQDKAENNKFIFICVSNVHIQDISVKKHMD